MNHDDLRSLLLGTAIADRHPAQRETAPGVFVEVRDPLYCDVEDMNTRYKDKPIAGQLFLMTRCVYSLAGKPVFTEKDLEVFLGSPMGGYLQALSADVGDRVKAGAAAGKPPATNPPSGSST